MLATLVAANLTKRIAYGLCRVVRIYGYNSQVSDRYIQLFQTPTVANGDVPVLKGLYAPASAPFDWELNTALSELLIAISSTQPNYTAVGAGTGLDMTLEISTDFEVGSANTIAGDLTTGVASLQVWTSANGPKKLLRLDVNNTGADDVWIAVQASDAADTADTKSLIAKVAAGDLVNLFFGKDGLVPYKKAGDATVHKGCSVRLATLTAGDVTLPLSFSAAADFNIRAIYE